MRKIFGEYPVIDLLPQIRTALPFDKIELKGLQINCKSTRLRLFASKDCECVKCGRRADRFVLELRDPTITRPHLSMYGRRENGTELLFTKDHILPKALSGSDALFNMQIMCEDCNADKACKISIWDVPAIATQIIKGQASLRNIVSRIFHLGVCA